MSWLSRSSLVLVVLFGLILPAKPLAQRVSAQPAGPRLVEVSATGLVFELDVPLPAVEEVQVAGRAMQRLSLSGFELAGAPGQPGLPQATVSIGIPVEGDVALRIVDAKVEDVPGAWMIYPQPNWVIQRDPQSGEVATLTGVQEQFLWDADAYRSDQFQPAEVVTLAETAFVRNQRLARVQIQPVQYNPAQGALRVYRYLRVAVTFNDTQLDAAQTAQASDIFDPFLQTQLLNYEQSLTWRSERGQPLAAGHAPASIYPGDTSRPWFKTRLSASGLYKVTSADLQGPELAPLAAANPAYLQVWTHGEQVATHFIGDSDAQFEAGEALLFYATITPDIYSETDLYWLTVGDTPALRMTTSSAAPAGAVTDSSDALTTHLEEDFIYRNDLPRYGAPASYPRWYWAELNSLFSPSYTLHAALPTALTSGYSAQLRVRMMGGSSSPTSPHHRVRVELNGQTVGVLTWNDFTAMQQEFQVPASWLRRGLNQVTFAVENQAGVGLDLSYLDWVEIDYRRSLAAVNSRLAFEVSGAGRREYQAEGFAGVDVLAFDVTTAAAPVRLTGLQAMPSAQQPSEGQVDATPAAVSLDAHQVYLPIAGAPGPSSNAAYSVRFGQTSDVPRSYELVRAATVSNVAPLSRDTGSTLRSTTNRADYLLISHRSLWPAAQTLADFRRARGLTVALIDVQDVYDEFSNGRLDPRALRDFVAYAYGNWRTPAPAYLMLLGSSHYDYRMRSGATTQPILVPTYFACVDPWVCEVAVENEFVTVSGDDRMPDLALGRLPARTLAEATVMVNKVIAYESNPPAGSWANTLVFVSDNARDADGVPDPAGNFEALTEGIIATVPSAYAVGRVYFDPYPADDNGEPYRYRTPTATTDAIVAAVNGGAVFLNYSGHAGVTTWAHEAILRARDVGRNDVTRFANGPRQPIVLDMACASGNFADPQYTGLEVMMLGWSSGGSVAGWAATGFGVATGHDQLHRGFYQAVFNNGVRTLGLATAAGKQNLWASGRNLDLLDTFDLLGDPALRINLQAAASLP